jgi:HAD superfamily hydrolase (TIGR01509 family)
MTLRALLWDVDGTLAETERDGHRVAFNQAFEALGLPWRWSEARYGELLAVTGGRERLLADMATRPDAPSSAAGRDVLARVLHRRKNLAYAACVAQGSINLREGVAALIDETAARGLLQGIATTTSRDNLHALLGRTLGPGWQHTFAAVVCGEDVAAKKPDPAVYTIALARLGITAAQALAIEDSPAGVAAARAAGVPVIVTRSAYFANEATPGAAAVGPGLHTRETWAPLAAGGLGGRVTLADLAAWHAAAQTPR